MNHPRNSRRRGAALLMVLISMATAMTLVLGWLASQDNSTLVAANSSHAAAARASAGVAPGRVPAFLRASRRAAERT